MTLRAHIRRLVRSTEGATMVEFAILAPMMIAMLLGVLQLGIALQNYNALRNLSADVARQAMVQYATGNALSNAQLEVSAMAGGVGAPYLLTASSMDAHVSDAATPRMTGVTEKSLTINYQIPTLFDAMGLRGPYISYTRPLFLTTPAS